MRINAYLTWLTVILAMLLYFKLADAFDSAPYGLPWRAITEEEGPRRNIKTDEDGVHLILLDPGECDASGCVMFEKYIEQWDGHKWIHQFIDNDGDDICDVIVVWKPLIDPSHGTYYAIFTTKSCAEAI